MQNRSDRLDPKLHAWLSHGALVNIFEGIATAGGEARVVGGAVRDALAGRPVQEVDLAVNLSPDAVESALMKRNIKIIPTGIEHGTLTAVSDHTPYEITSLRRDVRTDGRHAIVEFTDDWKVDASRRDFSINALYLDSSGLIYDYFNGRDDLERGRVRFIGVAEERIREDVLRILRFFRFSAWYSKQDLDGEGLKACRFLAHLVAKLSVERVWRELSKLLGAPDPTDMWDEMILNHVLTIVAPETNDVDRLGRLVGVERKYGLQAVALRRLAALLPMNAKSAERFSQRLKVSKRDTALLTDLAIVPSLIQRDTSARALRQILYDYGAPTVQLAAPLAAADDATVDLDNILDFCASWVMPVFSIQGSHLLAMGLQSGPAVGLLLDSVEDWWRSNDFAPSKEECLERARIEIDNTRPGRR